MTVVIVTVTGQPSHPRNPVTKSYCGVQVRITNADVVCFIAKDQALPTNTIDLGIERRTLNLKTPTGIAVDGLYFPISRALNRAREECKASDICLYESDVRPLDRYLMERFVRAGLQLHGQAVHHSNYLEFVNPKIRSIELKPQVHVVSLDIETDGFDGPVLSIAMHSLGATTANEFVILVANAAQVSATPFPVKVVATERDALRAMLQWFAEHDPDVIIGWNVIGFDLIALEHRFAHHGMTFVLGRAQQTARVLPAQGAGSLPLALIPGRVVLDGIECLASNVCVRRSSHSKTSDLMLSRMNCWVAANSSMTRLTTG